MSGTAMIMATTGTVVDIRGIPVTQAQLPAMADTDITAGQAIQCPGAHVYRAIGGWIVITSTRLGTKFQVQVGGQDHAGLQAIIGQLVAEQATVDQRRIIKVPCVGVLLVEIADRRIESPCPDTGTGRQTQGLEVGLFKVQLKLITVVMQCQCRPAIEQIIGITTDTQLGLTDGEPLEPQFRMRAFGKSGQGVFL